jgi:ABC-type hemin transport system substrate-binding protein
LHGVSAGTCSTLIAIDYTDKHGFGPRFPSVLIGVSVYFRVDPW